MSLPAGLRDLPLHFLGIAEGGAFTEPVKVQTLLGSCVAVTLHCRFCRAGGIFHALLPRIEDYPKHKGGPPYRFVDSGLAALLEAMDRAGADMRALEAKVFGGAGALLGQEAGVGLKNVRVALSGLTERGLRVSAVNVGGDRGRKLLFLPHTGEVYVKLLSRGEADLEAACVPDRAKDRSTGRSTGRRAG